MQSMKRLQIFLFGILVAMVMAPVFVDAAPAAIPLGCPGSKLQGPISPTANYSCPGGGSVVNGVYHAPGIVAGGGPVCVALPVFAGSQGSCAKGQVEIPNNPGDGGAIIYYLKLVLRLLNLLIGGIIILVLVIAGIQYITSMGDPTNVKNAKKRISNAVIALILYLMMFAILNFLVPGGILS